MHMIFANAVRHVTANPAQMLRILALPLVLNIAVELFVAHRYVLSDYRDEGYSVWLSILVNFVATGFIAVAMHRLILLDERPSFLPQSSGGLYYAYLAQWFVMGLVIMLLMLPFGGALLAVLWFVADAFALSHLMEPIFYSEAPTGLPFYLINLVLFTGFTALFFRCGAVLPHQAIGNQPVGMWSGWALTRGLARPIYVAALLAGIAQVLLMLLPSDLLRLLLEDSDGYLPAAFDYYEAVAIGVCYSIVPLFGAAILTEIYRNVDTQEFDKA